MFLLKMQNLGKELLHLLPELFGDVNILFIILVICLVNVVLIITGLAGVNTVISTA